MLSYHARGSPLVMALSWVVSVPGSPSSGVGTSRVRLPPTGTRTHGLEATFLFSSLLFCMVEARSLSGDVFTRRCLSRATPLLGDGSLGRRLSEAMTRAVNLLTSLPWVPWGVPPCVDSDLWSMPGDGTVHKPPSLELILVSAKRLRPCPIIHVAFLLT